MIKLKELLNDFNATGDEYEENDNGHWVSTIIDIKGHKFDLQSMIMDVPLSAIAQQVDMSRVRVNNSNRRALQFQFNYVLEDGVPTQETQNFGGVTVVIPLIREIAKYLKTKEALVDTFLFGGDKNREGPYSLFAKIVESQGWVSTKGYGKGPTGEPGVFFACFKKGS